MSSDLVVFALGAFVAALASGVAGTAFALLASAMWLHILPPGQAVPLIVLSSVLTNFGALWHLRDTIRFDLLWPFLVGGVIGVPLGGQVLGHADPRTFRLAVGGFLVVYAGFTLLRPPLRAIAHGGRVADGMVGVVGGFLGGAAGLNGVIPTIWCDLRGWPKDHQRGVYQPYIFIIHLVTLAWFGVSGAVDRRAETFLLAALPALALGTWLGLKLYRAVDVQQFRRVLMVLLLISGVLLLV